MPTLLEQLYAYDPDWRDNIASDPLEAAVEIGLLEPDVLDDTDYKSLNFHDEED